MWKNGRERYVSKIALAIGDESFSSWTVVGHGGLSYSSKQSGEFNISLIIAPVEDGITLFEKSVSTELPVGAIEMYQLRKTWHKNQVSQELYRMPPRNNIEFSIQPDDYEIIELGDVWSTETNNPLMKTLLGSKYLKYQYYQGDVKQCLYVPCVEVLRFYYASSSSFVKQAFSGKKATERLYNPKKDRTFTKFGYHFITLRKEVTNVDAPFIARIAFDDYARRQFENIYPKSAHDPDNPGKYIICTPPLSTYTRWSVNGVKKDNGFFVTRINSCSGEFPFSKLIFDRDNNNQGERDEPPEEIRKIQKKIPVFKNGEDKEGSNDEPTDPGSDQEEPLLGDHGSPSVDVIPLIFEPDEESPIFSGLEFTDLDKIKKLKLRDPTTKTVIEYVGVEVIRKLSTLDTSGSKNEDTAQLKINRSTDTEIDEDVISIHDVIFHLNQLLEKNELNIFHYTLYRDLEHPDHTQLTVPPVNLKDLRKDILFTNVKMYEAEFYHTESLSCLRPIALFTLQHKGVFFYFIEFLSQNGRSHDSLSSLLFSEAASVYSDDFIDQQLILFSEHGRTYKKEATNNSASTAFFAHRFTHSSKTNAEKRAKYIFDILLKALKSID